MKWGFPKVETEKAPLTGAVVVSFDVIQIMDGSVFSLEITTKTRVAWLSDKRQIWEVSTKMHIISAAAVAVFTFLRAVFLSAALPKAKPGPERKSDEITVFITKIEIHVACDQIWLFWNWKWKLFPAYFHVSPALKAMWASAVVTGSQTCSSVAVSNGNQAADGPLATFLGCHVEHTLHL